MANSLHHSFFKPISFRLSLLLKHTCFCFYTTATITFSLMLSISPLTTVYANPTDSVHSYRLKNGFRILVKEDHRSPLVISEVWYKTGSSYEYPGITGISHMLEHMMFRGTSNVPAGQFDKIIAHHGGEQNAFTSRDFTAYYQILPSKYLAICLRLEADRMKNLLLKQQAFQKERQVVMEERRMRTEDSPGNTTYERFAAIAYIANPYHNPVIGWMNDIQHFTVKDLQKWYHRWYAPNNALLVVVGNVNPQHVYQLAKRYFSHLKPLTLPPHKTPRAVKPLGERHVVVKVPAKLPLLIMGYNTPSLATAKKSWEPYALTVAVGILDGGESARLPKELIRGQRIAQSVDVDYGLYNRLDALLTISAIPAQGHNLNQLKQALKKEISRLQTQLIQPNELNRIKNQVIAAYTFKKDSMQEQADEIGSLESAGLSWQDADAFPERISAITPEQVQAVCKKYLQPNRLSVAELHPLPLNTSTLIHSRQSIDKGKTHVN